MYRVKYVQCIFTQKHAQGRTHITHAHTKRTKLVHTNKVN